MTLRASLLNGLVLPAAARVSGFDSSDRLRDMLEVERLPRSEIASRKLAALRELLAHAVGETRHYRELVDGTALQTGELPDMDAWQAMPITTKADLRRGFPERHVARSHRHRLLRHSNTSGTTGRPLRLVQDVGDISQKYASKLWSRRVGGVEPMGRVTRLTPNECQPCLEDGRRPEALRDLVGAGPGGWYVLLEDRVINPLFHDRTMLGPLAQDGRPPGPAQMDGILDAIDRSAPDILLIYPLYALWLARHILDTGRSPPRLHGVLDFSAGVVTPGMRAIIESGFGRRTTQCCGGCEFARYGASCPEDPDRMHLNELYCHVETLRPDGSPCEDGELGNLIVTSLHSRAQPMLRLEPGDVGRLHDEPCSCGRTSRRLTHEGRVQAVLRNAEGRWVTGRETWDRLLVEPGVALFQLRQHTPASYELAVLPSRGQEPDEGSLRHALAELLGAAAEVRIERVERIVPEASGKLQLVKSSTFEDFRVASARRDGVPTN